jgi:WD40 repeat protein
VSVTYDAFISYSHAKDKPVATALQSVVQKLGKPWYRRRALRLFRDDTSLSATPHLWPSIEQALGRSRFVILLASSEAAASRWVSQEIAYWLDHNTADTLLIALTDGELDWDQAAGDFRWSEATPLPTVLKKRFADEPRWIDIRPYRDSSATKSSEFVGLAADFAAAIRGIPKEDLLSEEVRQQRRFRNIAVVVGVALVALLGLAGWQWRVAETQRGVAEDRRIDSERQGVAAFTNLSNASLSLGSELEALIAAVKAGKKLQQEASLRDGSKSVYRALVALRRAIYEGHERNRIASGHFRGVSHLAFSPDGLSLYSAGGGGDIRRWGIDGTLESSFNTDHGALGDGCTFIQNFAISPDGNTLATIGNEGSFALWSPTGVRINGFDLQISGSGFCTGIANSKIDFLAKTMTVRDDKQESVWSFAGEMVHRTPMEPLTDEIRGASPPVASADGALIAETDSNRTVSVKRHDGTEVLKLQRQRTPAFSQRTGRIATVADDVDDSVIHLWDLTVTSSSPPKMVNVRDEPAPKKTIRLGDVEVTVHTTSAFGQFKGVSSPDGRYAAVVGGDNGERLVLWRLPDSTISSAARLADFDADQLASADFSRALDSLSFSPDSQMVASGGSDGTVKLWSLDGRLLRKIVAHSQDSNVRFSPDGRLLLTWGDIREGEVAIKLWSVDGELLDSLSKQPFKDAWFSADGLWILANGEDREQTAAWSLDLDQLLRKGCDFLRLYLANPATIEDRELCR